MTESAYYIQRKGQNPRRESASSHPVLLQRHRGNHIVAHPSPVYTTAKANRRQLIADKGSFDGVKGSRIRPHPLSWMQASGTFRAALTERQINVDRVSINCGEVLFQTIMPLELVAQQAFPLLSCAVADGRGTATTFNADSYSRCFRYLDCFDGGFDSCSMRVWLRRKRLTLRLRWATFKAVYLSSQLDRKTDCFDGGKDVRPESIQQGRFTQGRVWRVLHLVTFKAVCGTQTKQGGCLYEQPVVKRIKRCVNNVGSRFQTYFLKCQTRKGLIFFGTGQHFRSETQKPLPNNSKNSLAETRNSSTPECKSGSLMALPRGKDNRVLQGVFDGGIWLFSVALVIRGIGSAEYHRSTFKASCAQSFMLQAGKDTYRGKGRSYGNRGYG